MPLRPATPEEVAQYQAAQARPNLRPATAEEQAQYEAAQPGKVESFLRGAADTGTFGLWDEGAGALEAAYDKLTGAHEAFRELYAKHRDESRANQARAQEANPLTYLAGQGAGALAQGVATGGLGLEAAGLRGAMGAGAAAGALQGFGDSNAEGIEALGDAAKGAGVGALGGAALHGVSRAIWGAPEALEKAANTQAIRSGNIKYGQLRSSLQGVKGGQDAEHAAQALGEVINRRVVPQAGDNVEDIAAKSAKALEDSGKVLGGYRQSVDEHVMANAPELAPNPYELKDKLIDIARRYQTNADPGVSAAARGVVQDLRDMARVGDDDWARLAVGHTEMNDLLGKWGRVANFNKMQQDLTPSEQFMRAVYGETRSYLDDLMDRGVRDAANARGVGDQARAFMDDYLLHKHDYKNLLDFTMHSNSNVLRDIGNRMLGMSSHQVGQAAYQGMKASGDALPGVKAMAAAWVNQQFLKYGNAGVAQGARIAASGADKLIQVLGSDPGRFGRYAGVLGRAVSQGPQALAATHYTLSQTDSQYRQTYQKAVSDEPDER